MNAHIFDGREFARKKEKLLSDKVAELRRKNVIPKLVSILIGDDPASRLYISLKKKATERIGAELKVISLSQSLGGEEIIKTIEQFNNDSKVHGIMVQLPIPGDEKRDTRHILNAIAPEKDVDGLRENSLFVSATAKAVLSILDGARELKSRSWLTSKTGTWKIIVVGAKGMVGKSLTRELKSRNYEVVGIDLKIRHQKLDTKSADILISATGVPDLIKANMVRNGVAVIDVGSPKGDVQFNEVAKKASFITPVPGGVGPVTIVSLLENLINSASKK